MLDALAGSIPVHGEPGGADSAFSGSRAIVGLLEFDPDLGAAVPESELAEAGMASRAEILHLLEGPWSPPAPDPAGLGLLVLSGVLARTVRVGRRESLELLTPGDVIRPTPDEGDSIIGCDGNWQVLARGAAANLDGRFCRVVRPWPQIGAALAARGHRRARWLAVQAAIDAHPTVEERLMLMFCHLGDRVGRVSPEGIVLDLPLSHRLIAHAVRALRPSVTSGLLRLREDGRLLHPSRRTWIVTQAGRDYVDELCRQELVEC